MFTLTEQLSKVDENMTIMIQVKNTDTNEVFNLPLPTNEVSLVYHGDFNLDTEEGILLANTKVIRFYQDWITAIDETKTIYRMLENLDTHHKEDILHDFRSSVFNYIRELHFNPHRCTITYSRENLLDFAILTTRLVANFAR